MFNFHPLNRVHLYYTPAPALNQSPCTCNLDFVLHCTHVMLFLTDSKYVNHRTVNPVFIPLPHVCTFHRIPITPTDKIRGRGILETADGRLGWQSVCWVDEPLCLKHCQRVSDLRLLSTLFYIHNYIIMSCDKARIADIFQTQ